MARGACDAGGVGPVRPGRRGGCGAAGHREGGWRARQLLPRVMVYYVMALTLYAHASYDAVLRELVEGLRWLRWDGAALGLGVQVGHHPGPGAPGRSPAARTVPPGRPAAGRAGNAGRMVPGAPAGQLRRHNDRRPRSAGAGAALRPSAASRGSSGFPQLRLLALLETGTHAIFAAAIAGFATGEVTLARADRGCISGRACCAWPTAPSSATACGATPRRPAPTCSGAPAASRSFPVFSAWTTAPS